MTGRTIRTLLFLLATLPLAALGFGVLLAGWIVIPILAITPLVIPALVGFRAGVGGVARLDAGAADALLDAAALPRLRSAGAPGFWRSGLNVLRDETFWRQQAYLLLRCTLGFAVAVGEWSLLAASLGAVTLPIWYRWTETEVAGGWHVDSLGRALLCVPVGILGVVLALALIRPIAALFRRLADGMLGEADESAVSPALAGAGRRRALKQHAIAFGAFNLFLIVVWAFTSRGNFWPEWTLIVLGLPLAVHAFVVVVDERPDLVRRARMTQALALHGGIALSFALFSLLVWAVTGAGYFWPLWPILLLALAFTIHAGFEWSRRGSRITELEESRAGVVDQQEDDLARIERDLHDGAQARLVALGMSLGMAEQKLASDPHAAQQLLAEAQQGTREALEELRRLTRGIHPPVLVDRGLAPAIAALADSPPVRVNVTVDVRRRPSRAIETAAYFVAAEAIANSGKHARATQVDVAVTEHEGRLVIEIVDDGNGGANPNGSGLRGLARRVEALDGRLDVTSPVGGPTTIRAVIPCAS
ncbi:MAG: sensor domain-containing protein [Gaiellaceae bacterium]